MTTTIFNEHCKCCDAPITLTYDDERFVEAKCGCPFRWRIRQEEHDAVVAKMPSGELVNRWPVDDRRHKATQEWIDKAAEKSP